MDQYRKHANGDAAKALRIDETRIAHAVACDDLKDLLYTTAFKKGLRALEAADGGLIAFQKQKKDGFTTPAPKALQVAYDEAHAALEKLVRGRHAICECTLTELELAVFADGGPLRQHDMRASHFNGALDEKTFLPLSYYGYSGEAKDPEWDRYRDIVKLLIEGQHISFDKKTGGDNDAH